MAIGCLRLIDVSIVPCCQPTSNVSKIFGSTFRVQTTGQGNDFELIPMVKMETRNPVTGYFGSEFPAICNHCEVMEAWSRKTLKVFEQFLRFLFRKFSLRHRSTCWVQISWNLADKRSVKSCVAGTYVVWKRTVSSAVSWCGRPTQSWVVAWRPALYTPPPHDHVYSSQ